LRPFGVEGHIVGYFAVKVIHGGQSGIAVPGNKAIAASYWVIGTGYLVAFCNGLADNLTSAVAVKQYSSIPSFQKVSHPDVFARNEQRAEKQRAKKGKNGVSHLFHKNSIFSKCTETVSVTLGAKTRHFTINLPSLLAFICKKGTYHFEVEGCFCHHHFEVYGVPGTVFDGFLLQFLVFYAMLKVPGTVFE
jgi:hypothetical protein